MNYCPVCNADRKLLLCPSYYECQECFSKFDCDEQFMEDSRCEHVDDLIEVIYKCKLCGKSVTQNLPMREPFYSTEDPTNFFMNHPEIARLLVHQCNKKGDKGVLEFCGIKV